MLELCDTCHNYTVPVCNTAQGYECARQGIGCGPQVSSAHAATTTDEYEAEVAEDEIEEVEGTDPHSSQCDAWEDFGSNAYSQILEFTVRIFLACAAFHSARRLAAHTYFISGGGGPRHNQVPVQTRRNATQPQVLQACVVQPIPFESEIPSLAPGEVMAASVHTETNPVAGCVSVSACPTQPAAAVVMATPIPR